MTFPLPLLRDVKASRFDFIRLSVDPGPLLARKGKERAALAQHRLVGGKQIRGTGLDVLVDFHPIDMVKEYSPQHLESDRFLAYAAMLRRITHRLAALGTEHIAIEPMNEPQLGYNMFSAMRWQHMMEQLYEAVRAESPGMTVIATGAQSESIDGLLKLDPAPFDAHARYCFHYYEPFVFTNIGVNFSAENARIWPFVTGLPYPAKAEEFEPFWKTVEARVKNSQLAEKEKTGILAEGKKQLEEYFHGKGTRAAIAADFSRVSAWAEAQHIAPQQIFLGEFGATQVNGSDAKARARWISDVRQEAESHGFHWSFWALYGESASGMTLVSVADPNHIDALTASALGRTPSSPPRQ